MALTQTGNYREEIDKLLGQYIFHNTRMRISFTK